MSSTVSLRADSVNVSELSRIIREKNTEQIPY